MKVQKDKLQVKKEYMIDVCSVYKYGLFHLWTLIGLILLVVTIIALVKSRKVWRSWRQ